MNAEQAKCTGTGRARRVIQYVFLAFWILVLWSGLGFKASARFLGWPQWRRYKLHENRVLATFPKLSDLPAKEWGRGIEQWYNDNFAWRAVLVRSYRVFNVSWLRTDLAGSLLAREGWTFKSASDWKEVEDYLGAQELTEEELAGWRTQLEGRVTWAKEHGFGYAEVITPVKARIHPEKMMPWIAAHRGINMVDQVREKLKGSFAEAHVVFAEDDFMAATQQGQILFYQTDHHPNARGTYLLFDIFRRAIAREVGRELPPAPPWYEGEPPPEVDREEERGCFERDIRLCVREPGQHEVNTKLFACMQAPGGPGTSRSRMVVNDQAAPDALRVLITHNSFLRFGLSSWRFEQDMLRFPLGLGFREIASVMWGRFTTSRLDYLAGSPWRADVLVEEFPSIKLNFGIDPDETMERAAAWGNGTDVTPSDLKPGEPVRVCVRLLQLTDSSGKWTDMRYVPSLAPEIHVRLLAEGHDEPLAEWTTWPALIRALFSDEIPWPDAPLRVECEGGGPSQQPPEILLRRAP